MTTRTRLSILVGAALVTAAPLVAQPLSDGWEEPVPGALLSAVYQERVSAEQIAEEGIPFFEEYAMPDPLFAADVYRVVFWSSDADGSPVRISASLYLPVSEQPVSAPVLAFGSGTTGVGDQCAPSLENPRIVRLGWYRANMLAYAGQGVITIFPDYTGFNDPTIPQRYFSKFAEGYLMLDAIRAARAVASSIRTVMRTNVLPADESFTAGYSQGGHAAFAAADLWREYAPDLKLAGAIGFGATASVEALFRDAGYYPPNIIYSYQHIYGDRVVRAEEILQPQWLANLEMDVLTQCVNEFQRYYPRDPRDLFTDEFYQALTDRRLEESFPVFKRILDENESGLSGHGLPVLVVQGLLDWIASTDSQREYVERLEAAGSRVDYLEIPGVAHRYTRPAGFIPSVDFMREAMGR